MAKNADPAARECRIFMCDRRRGAYCCRKCKDREKCKNPCLNSPERCGAYNEGGGAKCSTPKT